MLAVVANDTAEPANPLPGSCSGLFLITADLACGQKSCRQLALTPIAEPASRNMPILSKNVTALKPARQCAGFAAIMRNLKGKNNGPVSYSG